MTNYEKLKNMSVEDLAAFITDLISECDYGCMHCSFYINSECSSKPCPYSDMRGCIDWLNLEVNE